MFIFFQFKGIKSQNLYFFHHHTYDNHLFVRYGTEYIVIRLPIKLNHYASVENI